LIKHLYSFGHMGFVPLACITPNGHTKPSAIAARGSSARYNSNSWLVIEGALHSVRKNPDGFSVLGLFTNPERRGRK
jgi:hypothetical protein